MSRVSWRFPSQHFTFVAHHGGGLYAAGGLFGIRSVKINVRMYTQSDEGGIRLNVSMVSFFWWFPQFWRRGATQILKQVNIFMYCWYVGCWEMYHLVADDTENLFAIAFGHWRISLYLTFPLLWIDLKHFETVPSRLSHKITCLLAWEGLVGHVASSKQTE